jgi:hypothetical protein
MFLNERLYRPMRIIGRKSRRYGGRYPLAFTPPGPLRYPPKRFAWQVCDQR